MVQKKKIVLFATLFHCFRPVERVTFCRSLLELWECYIHSSNVVSKIAIIDTVSGKILFDYFIQVVYTHKYITLVRTTYCYSWQFFFCLIKTIIDILSGISMITSFKSGKWDLQLSNITDVTVRRIKSWSWIFTRFSG